MESPCPVARAMDILGERWTLLILRESFLGSRRFSELQRNLGIARNILSARLNRLVHLGVLERQRYQEDPERFEYLLTPMGRELYPVILAVGRWGEKHLSSPCAAPVLRHACGHAAPPEVVCAQCGEALEAPEPVRSPAAA